MKAVECSMTISIVEQRTKLANGALEATSFEILRTCLDSQHHEKHTAADIDGFKRNSALRLAAGAERCKGFEASAVLGI